MLITLLAAFLIGFSGLGIVGCGDESNATGSDTSTPGWVLQLPRGAQYGAWSPDGEVFAFPAHDKIELIKTDGSTARTIDVPGIDNSGLSCECRLAWSKDGAEIHIVTRPRPRARGGVATVDADGGKLRYRYLAVHISDAAWAPQGWPLVLVPGDTVHQAGQRPREYPLLRLSSLAADPDVLLERRGEIFGTAFSPDGNRIAFTADAGRGRGVWTISPHGGKPRLLLGGLRDPYVSWSPNGRELAVSAIRPKRDLGRHIFLVSAADGKARLLTNELIIIAEPPAWTPNGRWITYVGADNRGADSSVNKIRRDGTGRQRLFQLPGEEIAGLSWSPDGRQLAHHQADHPQRLRGPAISHAGAA